MALTRPLLSQLNTNIIAFSDNMMVINAGNVANRDLGMVFDRSVNSQSNVALFWQESSSSFTFAQTTSSGLNNANIVVGLTANVVLGNIILAGNGSAGIFYANGSIFGGGGGGTPGGNSGQLQYNNLGAFAGAAGATFNGTNVSVTGFNVNNSATIGTTLGVTGNITGSVISSTNNGAGTNFKVGDDTWLGDINLSNTLSIRGQQDGTQAYVVFGNTNTQTLGRSGAGALTYQGGFTAQGGLQNTPIGNATPGTALFTTVGSSGNTTVSALTVNATATIGTTLGVTGNISGSGVTLTGSLVATGPGDFDGGLQSTPIGNAAPSTALFTTVGSSGNATVSALTVNATATIGTTLGVTGNISGSGITLTGSLRATGPGDFDGGLQSTPIGNAAASTGQFTTIGATGTFTGTTINAAAIGNTGATLTGTIQTAAQTNITSVGTLSGLNVTASNVSVAITDSFNTITATKNLRVVSGSRDLALIANIGGGNYNSLTTSNDSSIIFTGPVLGNAAFTISPWAATTSGIRISSVSNVATIRLAATTIQVDGNITNGGTSGTGNIGAVGATFNTVFAKATTAQYADLAEIYIADDNYPSGTVVVFGGIKEITVTSTAHDTRVAGVISTNPAYLMNSEVQGLPVALTGRVPCLVQGPINKGEVLVTGLKPGTAQKINPARFQPGCVIGKSIENIPDDELKLIEIVVGRF